MVVKELAGIYAIRNLVNENMYIGQSINLYHRKAAHFSFLSYGTHHNVYLQRAYNFYGKDAFVFDVLLYCEPNELTRYEQELVNKLKPKYNLRTICVDSPRGTTKSEELKQQISKKLMGRIFTDEHRRKKSDAQRGERNHRFGKKYSQEELKRLSEIKIGEKNSFFGKHHTDETKRKLSEIKLGKKRPEDVRLKVIAAITGRKNSPETIERMKQAQKIRREKEKQNKEDMNG